jgi:hypothetical protein
MSNARQCDLYQAYGWTCDNCGRDNVARQVHVDSQMDGNLTMTTVFCPCKTVTCAFCNETYAVPEAAQIEPA